MTFDQLLKSHGLHMEPTPHTGTLNPARCICCGALYDATGYRRSSAHCDEMTREEALDRERSATRSR